MMRARRRFGSTSPATRPRASTTRGVRRSLPVLTPVTARYAALVEAARRLVARSTWHVQDTDSFRDRIDQLNRDMNYLAVALDDLTASAPEGEADA